MSENTISESEVTLEYCNKLMESTTATKRQQNNTSF